MALVLKKQLLITWQDLVDSGVGISTTLSLFDSGGKRDRVLQKIHNLTYLDADNVYCMDSRFSLEICTELQIALGLHILSRTGDTAAGTGSIANQTIDSFSQSNTMAKNNAPFDDARNMTQYGTDFYNIIKDNDPKVTMMVT